jgi:phage-related protein
MRVSRLHGLTEPRLAGSEMTNFRAVYYREADGTEPVNDFIDGLHPDRQAVLDSQIDRLNILSDEMPRLPFPHSSQIEGELRELRAHYGRDLYRILYRRSGRLIILLHIFQKRTGAVPNAEIAVAQGRWEDFRRRMDAQPRIPPRAAGRDAP